MSLTDIGHSLLALVTFFFVTLLDLRVLRGTFRILIEGDDWTENGTIELLELIGFVLCTLRVSLRNVKVTFGIGEFL